MNIVTLIGRLTRDPELKCTPQGKYVCDFSIAVDRGYTNKEGEREADFINCVVWDKQAENLPVYQHKGNLIAVEGSYRVDVYQNEHGKNIYKNYVLASHISYLSPAKSGKQEEKPEAEEQTNNIQVDPYSQFGQQIENDLGNDLPFDENDLPF